MRAGPEGIVRSLIGHERTRARKAVAALTGAAPTDVARLLGMRRHTVAAVRSRLMLPGRTFAERAARLVLAS